MKPGLCLVLLPHILSLADHYSNNRHSLAAAQCRRDLGIFWSLHLRTAAAAAAAAAAATTASFTTATQPRRKENK